MSQAAHTEHTSPPPVRVNTEVVGERKTSPTLTIDERGELIRRTAASRASRHRCRCVHMTCFSRRPPSLWCCRQETRERVARRRSPTQGFIGFRACRSHEEPSPAALICSFRPSSLVPSCRLRQSQEQWRERGTSAAPHKLSSNQCASQPADPLVPALPVLSSCAGAKSSDPGIQGRTPLRTPAISLIPHGGTRRRDPSSGQERDGPPAPGCALCGLSTRFTRRVFWRLASVCPNSGTHVSRAQCLQLLQPTCSAGAAAAFLKDKKGQGYRVWRAMRSAPPDPSASHSPVPLSMWGTWASRLEYKTGRQGAHLAFFLSLNSHCRSPVSTLFSFLT